MSERKTPWTLGFWEAGWGNGVTGPRASFGPYLSGKDFYRVPIRCDAMHPVAWVIESRPCDESMVDADARLIAASTELVEALEGFVNAFDDEGAHLAEVTDQYRDAQALLAKIYGESA